ncbi:C40 family peptidase [Tepidimonas charontis]|uniref:Murein DD-endopeptidase MepH n=1 Tax=Tepidimonas charontis TaxID=2267262 RepID=A0A554XB91_9BURK|nr:C40 family peptidase [Tepidimonas charontis]TSE33105.1 Murein DD-endopeptidase MepH [Tepidimonas charontis]
MLRLLCFLVLVGYAGALLAAPVAEDGAPAPPANPRSVADVAEHATAPVAGPSTSLLAPANSGSGPLAVGDWVRQLQTVGADTGTVASRLVDTALGLIGVPYRMGGGNPQTGLDCSGLVRYVYANTLGLVLPRRAAEQAQTTTPIAKDELRPGDLVFFNTMRRAFSHVGVYLGDGKFIHSPRKGDSVKISDMNDRYWARRFNGARRVEALDGPVR